MFSDFLNAMCIVPLREGMRIALETGLSLTGTCGWAIILLSLAVNAALWPIYALAEGWQEEERALRRKMEAKLAEIRAVYHGRERHFFTAALYRLHGYHPLLALRSGFGLLIQVPFFLAAYGLLNHAPELEGVTFWFIRDMSLPDGLLRLGSFSLNLLPLLMTGANLFAASLYASRLSRRDRVQSYVLALIFLLLLYNASAGLLLYWTCNNIFSIFKNCFYLRYVYEDSRAGRPTLGQLFTCLNVLSAALASRAHRIPLWLEALTQALTIILLLILDNNLPRFFSVSLPLTVFFFLVIALTTGVRRQKLRALGDPGMAAWFSSLLFLAVPLCFYVMFQPYTRMTQAGLMPQVFFQMGAMTLFVVWLLALPPCAALGKKMLAASARVLEENSAVRLFFASCLCMAVLIFLYHPAQIYASDPDFFSETPAQLFGQLTFNVLFLAGLSRLLFRKSNPATRPFLTLIVVWLTLIALLYSFAVNMDYGVMSGQHLDQSPSAPGTLLKTASGFIDAGILIGTALGIFLLGRRQRIASLDGVLRGLALVMIVPACWQLVQAPSQQQRPDMTMRGIPDYTERLFSFSRNGRNIVVFMLDQFTGEHMRRLLQEDPELFTPFDGFIWYRDTISAGSQTAISFPSMLGGPGYTSTAFRTGATGLSWWEMANKAYAVLPNALQSRGYDISYMAVDMLQPDLLGKYCPAFQEVLIVPAKYFFPWWAAEQNVSIVQEGGNIAFLSVYGLFKTAPLILRHDIYDGGRWMHSFSKQRWDTFREMAFFEALLRFSHDNAERDVFKFYASTLTHDPWDLDEEGRFSHPVIPTRTRDKDGVILEHLWAEKSALRYIGRWLFWLQEIGLYDNTQVVLLSDHGTTDAPSLDNKPYERASSLLMVKNFNNRGSFRISDAPMISSDLLGLICQANAELCAELPHEDIPEDPEQRRRVYSLGSSNLTPHTPNVYRTKDYLLKGPLDKAESWSELGDY